jgi:DNA-binding beta-propeller fold protein YncE
LGLGLVVLLGVVASAAYQSWASIVEVRTWGSDGSANGQFHSSEGIATSPSGDVYVSDTGNDRVQRFAANGKFLSKWGRSGAANGQFRGLNGIATNSDGDVYVADSANFRVQRFTRAGGFLGKWGSKGSGNGQFGFDPGLNEGGPFSLDVDPAGNVYVTDYYNNRIQKFSPSGQFLDKWSASLPYGVTTDDSGHVYVSEDTANRIEKFSSSGQFLLMWGWGVKDGSRRLQTCGPPRSRCQPGIAGSGKSQLACPLGLDSDADSNVYVADFCTNRVLKFGPGGRFLTTWGSRGSGEDQFVGPADVATDSSRHVYVMDQINGRVVKFAQVRPQTSITNSTIKRRLGRAKFRFTSSEPNSTFKCQIDQRRFRYCESPKRYSHLKTGRHIFRVKAIDGDRLVDPTPAKKSFRIRR